jgi:hypothetical protein
MLFLIFNFQKKGVNNVNLKITKICSKFRKASILKLHNNLKYYIIKMFDNLINFS